MLEELPINLIEYGVSGGVHLAVDVNRNDFRRMALDLSKELEYGCGLSRARRTQAEGIDRSAALESRSDAELEAVHLGFTVQEVLRQMV